MPDTEKIRQQALPLLEATARFINRESEKLKASDVEEKFANNLVTYVDTTAEQRLVEGLRVIVPEAGFITEEETARIEGRPLEWIIDPLDGTTNYIYGVPSYCISVALRHEGEVILGMVWDCVFGRCYHAQKGGPAFVDAEKIEVAQRQRMEQALIATGFPYYDFSGMAAYERVFKHLMKTTRGLRRLGSAALDLCHVASGIYDAYFEYSLHAWDVAAGALIVQQAGGRVTDFSGGDDYLFGSQIVAGSSAIHPELLQTIQREFRKGRLAS